MDILPRVYEAGRTGVEQTETQDPVGPMDYYFLVTHLSPPQRRYRTDSYPPVSVTGVSHPLSVCKTTPPGTSVTPIVSPKPLSVPRS